MKKFKNWSMMKKVNYVVNLPFEWFRKLAIPPCDEEEYDNWLTIIWPYFGILFLEMLCTNHAPTTHGYYYYLPAAVIWSFCFWYFHRDKKRNETTKVHIFISVIGMICGFAWTFYVSGLLIDILTLLGVISKLSATYLALTIIAVGNALPDALLTM
jgi:Ca2+/Na+ antiporter